MCSFQRKATLHNKELVQQLRNASKINKTANISSTSTLYNDDGLYYDDELCDFKNTK